MLGGSFSKKQMQSSDCLFGIASDSAVETCERGSVVVFLVMLSVALVVMAGMAINTALWSAEWEDKRQEAEFLALAALKKYSDTTGTTDYRLEQARLRAEQIASANTSAAQGLTVDPHAEKEIGVYDRADPESLAGYIVPGYWHKEEPDDCTGLPSPCPCQGGVWSGACFEVMDLDDPLNAGREPNAFEAVVYNRADSPIQNLFGKVTGFETSELEARSIAVVQERHGVFLVDLSRSSHVETHIPYETTDNTTWHRAAESAFKLSNTACPGDRSNPCLPPASPPAPPATGTSCTFEGGIGAPSLYSGIWNYYFPAGTGQIEDTRGGISDADKHFKDDYQCFAVSYQDDDEPAVSENYLIDTYRGVTPTAADYEGPEPLSTFFEGIHEALEIVNTGDGPATKLGIVGFDRSAKIDKRIIPLSQPGSLEFQDMLLITDIENEDAASRIKRFEDYIMFPRADGYSNYPAALRQALDMLTEDIDAPNVENFVMILSDGLTNCSEGGVCNSDETSYLSSVSESLNIVLNDYVANNVRLDFVVASQTSQPHTMLMRAPSNPSECLSDEDARLSNPPTAMVDYTTGAATFEQASLGNGFYYNPNQFYNAVVATDGFWEPLRPCCTVAGSCSDVTTVLNTACENSLTDIVVAAPHTDAFGRLICDAGGRDRRTQIKEVMRKILARTPFVLVE